MRQTVGQTTDNGPKVGLRRGSLGPMPLVPEARTPSASLVSIVAVLVTILILGATVVVWRHVSGELVSGQSTQLAPMPPPVGCWQGQLPAGVECAPLAGDAALRWIFQANPDFQCQESQRQEGELHTLRCEWPDLNAQAGADTSKATYVFLSEWENQQKMVSYYDALISPGELISAGEQPSAAIRWSSLTPKGSGPATAIAYANLPYSVLVMGPQAERDIAEKRITLRAPNQLQEQL